MIPPYRADIGDQIEVPLSMTNVTIPPYMPYRNIGKWPHFNQASLEVTRMDKDSDPQ
jgi:ferredoxin-nitrate reductase